MSVVLKVLVILEAILEVVVEALEIRWLSFLILVFLHCIKVFSLLLKMVLCRFVKVVIKFLLHRCLVVSYFSLEVADLASIVDALLFSFSYYGLFNVMFFLFDLQGF